MRPAVLALLVAAQLLPVTYLVVDMPAPPEALAGQRVELDGRIQLQGPTGDLPGLGTEVDLTLVGPPEAGCQLQTAGDRLGLLTGDLPVRLSCRPRAPGDHELEVIAKAEPHGPGRWNGTLAVAPDRLTATLEAGAVDGFQVPLLLTAEPEHLDTAPVELALTADLQGSPLRFDETHGPFDVEGRRTIEVPWTARHGPGTYAVAARLDGPSTEPWSTDLEIVVPEPPENASLDLDVTVEGPGPSVALTSDSVNDDGKRKRPGQALITRLTVEGAPTVDVTVLRPVGNRAVVLADETLEVPEDGRVEHRFSHPVLPKGPLAVVAQAGNASVGRTAEILDAATTATVAGPVEILGDGRPIDLVARFQDDNLGSTPADPGPVWGLPDVTWTVFRGSRPAPGWNVTLGPFDGGPEGLAELSRLAWPHGAAWANVTDGQADVPVTLTPPPDAADGQYRLSLYEGDTRDDRLGGLTFELASTPHVELAAAGPPIPLAGWPVEVTLAEPTAGTSVNLTTVVAGDRVDVASLPGSGNVTVELPDPLPAGTPVRLEAWATWPGRPPAPVPDARLEANVPALGPRIDAWASLDGTPVPDPVAVHPAGAHELVIHPQAADPNGDPVDLSVDVLAPDGAPAPWPVTIEETIQVEIPADQPAGRYTVELTARTPDDDPVVHRLPVDMAPVTRLAVDGPTEVLLGTQTTQPVEVTVINTGTTRFEGLVADLRGPDGLTARLGDGDGDTVAMGDSLPVNLGPGGSTTLVLHLDAGGAAEGSHAVRLTVAGVIP